MGASESRPAEASPSTPPREEATEEDNHSSIRPAVVLASVATAVGLVAAGLAAVSKISNNVPSNSLQNDFEARAVGGNPNDQINIPVTLRPPPEDWIKLNTDGSVRQKESFAGAGGLMRDSRGRWLGGFCVNLGYVCTVTDAELYGLCYGLELAWDAGARKVRAEVDNEGIVESILNKKRPGNLVLKIRNIIINRPWEVDLSSISRKANRGADYLAGKAIEYGLGVTRFSQHDNRQPDNRLTTILSDDY